MRDINLEIRNSFSNQSRTQFFKKWYLDRGLRLVNYQQDILSNKIEFKGEPIVLAVSPGGGKTIMSIAAIEKYCHDNPNHRVLVLTHGQTNLRLQYSEDIINVRPKFSWAVVGDESNLSREMIQINSKEINNCNAQVIISLPHSICTKNLHQFDLVVVDEANHFYFGKMEQTILKNVDPKNQLLLTGTPSPFIAKKFNNIIAVSLEMLNESGMVSDPVIEVVGSKYDFKMKDYNDEQELKNNTDIKTEDTDATLYLVLKELWKKTGRNSNWNEALKTFSKTMLVCRNQKQAKDAYSFFIKKNIS